MPRYINAVVIGDLCMAIIRRSKIVNEIAKKISAESLRSEQ